MSLVCLIPLILLAFLGKIIITETTKEIITTGEIREIKEREITTKDTTINPSLPTQTEGTTANDQNR
jgi:hypothetical protein